MLMNDASADEVRNHMQECSTIKINMKVAAYETANKMKAVLTSEQQEMMKEMMMHKQEKMHGEMMKGDKMK
jgi:Spy/CpxP family protein refolding chaperone